MRGRTRVLLEQVENRGDPTLTEPHSGPHPLSFQFITAGIGALLEERDAGLCDELLAEQERRVRRSGWTSGCGSRAS